MIGIYSIGARARLLNIFVVKRNLFHVVNNESRCHYIRRRVSRLIFISFVIVESLDILTNS